MHEGFYSVQYGGAAGTGFGMMVLDTGHVIGADPTGGTYDGTYRFNPTTNFIDLEITVTVPPGVWLVQGVPGQPQQYTFDIKTSVPRDLGKRHPVTIPTPFGNVAVIFTKVRDFPN